MVCDMGFLVELGEKGFRGLEDDILLGWEVDDGPEWLEMLVPIEVGHWASRRGPLAYLEDPKAIDLDRLTLLEGLREDLEDSLDDVIGLPTTPDRGEFEDVGDLPREVLFSDVWHMLALHAHR